MMHTTQALYDELYQQVIAINKQIDNGKPILSDLMVAKAQLLSGMAALKAADLNSKAPRPGSRS